VDLQHFKDSSFNRIIIKWKDNPEDEVLWEFKNEVRESCPNFVNEDNDLIGNWSSVTCVVFLHLF
jgi:hypothetical protein